MADRVDHEKLVEEARADREIALDAASRESYHRTIAEDEEMEARIVANKAAMRANELETENRILDTEMRTERERADANSFGLVLAVCIVLAVLVIGGFWMWGQLDRGRTIYADSSTGRTVVVRPGAR